MDAEGKEWEALRTLEERVRQAVEELGRLRAERDAARSEAASLRTALEESRAQLRRLQSQAQEFESERAQVRERIEQLMAQIDSLTGGQA